MSRMRSSAGDGEAVQRCPATVAKVVLRCDPVAAAHHLRAALRPGHAGHPRPSCGSVLAHVQAEQERASASLRHAAEARATDGNARRSSAG